MSAPALPTTARVIARTDRLVLRTWTAADVDRATEMWSDPETMRFAGAVPRERVPRALVAGLGAQARHGVCLWAVESPESGLVGDCGFHARGDGLELGYHLIRRFWGRGYATEAARAAVAYGQALIAGRPGAAIRAWVSADNHRSSAVLERLGFVCEGPDPAEDDELRYRLPPPDRDPPR